MSDKSTEWGEVWQQHFADGDECRSPSEAEARVKRLLAPAFLDEMTVEGTERWNILASRLRAVLERTLPEVPEAARERALVAIMHET